MKTSLTETFIEARKSMHGLYWFVYRTETLIVFSVKSESVKPSNYLDLPAISTCIEDLKYLPYWNVCLAQAL